LYGAFFVNEFGRAAHLFPLTAKGIAIATRVGSQHCQHWNTHKSYQSEGGVGLNEFGQPLVRWA
jgi:hypothetical protein